MDAHLKTKHIVLRPLRRTNSVEENGFIYSRCTKRIQRLCQFVFLCEQISAILASIWRQQGNRRTLIPNANVGLLHVHSEHTGESHTVRVWRFSACSVPEEQTPPTSFLLLLGFIPLFLCGFKLKPPSGERKTLALAVKPSPLHPSATCLPRRATKRLDVLPVC